MGKIGAVKDVVNAVLNLAQADQVTREVLHVDGGAHAGRLLSVHITGQAEVFRNCVADIGRERARQSC